MKIIKISTIAALMLSSSVYAIDVRSDNPSDIYSIPSGEPTEKFKIASHKMKAAGHIKLWYQTMNHGGVDGEGGFFNRQTGPGGQANEWMSVSAHLKVTGDATENFSYGAAVQGSSSVGTNSYISAREAVLSTGSQQVPFWFSEMYGVYKAGNTHTKMGRMELDTPLAYTEKWNAVSNTFEALQITNTDIPNTKVMGLFIAKGNGATTNFIEAPQVFGAEATFNGYTQYDYNGTTISRAGMLVAGVKNHSISKNMPLQAWYYLTPDAIQAFWLQGDVKGDSLGFLEKPLQQVIGAGNGATGALQNAIKDDVFNEGETKTGTTYAVAAKAAASVGAFTVYGAASKTTEGNLPIANTATNYKKTKLPTACVFNDGMVAAQPGTTAFKVGGSAKIGSASSVALAYGNYTVGKNSGYLQPNAMSGGPASAGWIANDQGKDLDMNEFDLVFSTKYKDIKMKAIYVYLDKTYVPGTDNSTGSLGTHNNHVLRLITSLQF